MLSKPDPDPRTAISSADLLELENTAVELARIAGAEITNALTRPLSVRYKNMPADEEEHFRDPVSEIDHRAEVLIRARLADRFPEHDIIGEEIDERPGLGHDFVWAVDPIDGTAGSAVGRAADRIGRDRMRLRSRRDFEGGPVRTAEHLGYGWRYPPNPGRWRRGSHAFRRPMAAPDAFRGGFRWRRSTIGPESLARRAHLGRAERCRPPLRPIARMRVAFVATPAMS